MKRAFVFCLLVLLSTACLQTSKSTDIEVPVKSSTSPNRTMIKEGPAKFVLQEEDLPPGFTFDIGWYQDLEVRASYWDDPEEGKRKLMEWGYINSYINRFRRDFDSPMVFIEPFVILSKASRYETSDGAKKGYDHNIHKLEYEGGYKVISSLDIGDEGVLLKYTFRVEDSDFSYYVVLFKYQNTLNSVLVLGYVGTPNQDEVIGLAKIIEDRLELLEK